MNHAFCWLKTSIGHINTQKSQSIHALWSIEIEASLTSIQSLGQTETQVSQKSHLFSAISIILFYYKFRKMHIKPMPIIIFRKIINNKLS